MNTNILVIGLSDPQYEGVYIYDGQVNGRPSYRLNGSISVYWNSTASEWRLENSGLSIYASGDDDVPYPWWVSTWNNNGIDPAGIYIEESLPSEPGTIEGISGGPGTTYDLITRNFGTVQNFNRLRLLGYV